MYTYMSAKISKTAVPPKKFIFSKQKQNWRNRSHYLLRKAISTLYRIRLDMLQCHHLTRLATCAPPWRLSTISRTHTHISATVPHFIIFSCSRPLICRLKCRSSQLPAHSHIYCHYFKKNYKALPYYWGLILQSGIFWMLQLYSIIKKELQHTQPLLLLLPMRN